MFNGKDFGGNKIKVERGGDNVVCLSQKRERSPSRQVLTLIPTSRAVAATVRTSQEIHLTGEVRLGGAPREAKEEVKTSKQEVTAEKTAGTARVEAGATKNEVGGNTVGKGEETGKKLGAVEKIEKTVEKSEVKNEKPIEKGIEKEESKGSVKEEVKEDNLMIELEGSKFLKTADDNKLHCIACDKEITKKGLKAHVISKAHKNLV